MLQKVCKLVHSLGRGVIAEVNVCVGKGLVGWSEDRERTGSLERLQKPCLNHSIDQRREVAVALSGSWNVVG